MKRVISWVQPRLDLVALGLLVAAIPALPGPLPSGIAGLGVVSGAELAIAAIGIVLIYRSDRIINFSLVPLGLAASALFRLLVQQQTFLMLLRRVCPGCATDPSSFQMKVNYWLSASVALAMAVGLSFLAYHLVIKKFRDAPRLVLTVATIGLGGIFASVQAALPRLLATEDQRRRSSLPRGVAAGPPFDFSLKIPPTIFDASDLSMVILAVGSLLGLTYLFRYRRIGIGMKAAADSPSRALTLGMDVESIGARVWVLAGALTGLVAIVAAMSSAGAEPGSLSVASTVRILSVAVLARMSSPVRAVATALAIGVLDQAMLWAFESTSIADGSFLGLIAVTLLLQKASKGRVEDEAMGAWRADRDIRSVPAQLKEVGSVRTGSRLVVFLIGALALGSPWILSPSQTSAAAVILIYAMVGLSLLVLTGWGGQISLGQFAFAAIGAYVTALLSDKVGAPMFVCIAAGAVVGGAAAVAIGIPALKLKGFHLAVMTLAFSLTVSAFLLDPSFLGGFLPEKLDRPTFLGMDLADQRTFYYLTLVILIGMASMVWAMRRSRAGRALIAARDNDVAASSFAISVVKTRLAAFAFAGTISAAAGGLFAFHQNGVRAAAFTPEISISVFLMAVIGGMGSISGPILGAAYLGALTLLTPGPAVGFLATGGGLVILLLVAPGGLSQLIFSFRDSLLKRIAERHRLLVPSLMADEDIDAFRNQRFPIEPKLRPGGGTEFVPERYRLDDQWGIEAPVQPESQSVV